MSSKNKTRSTASKKVNSKHTSNIPTAKRLLFAFALILLIIFSFLGWRKSDAVVINALFQGEKAFLGWGAWVFPFSLILVVYIIIDSIIDNAVKLPIPRIVFSILFSIIIGAFFFLIKYASFQEENLIPFLWNEGLVGNASGLLSGLLGFSLRKLLGKVGAIIILLILAIVCILGILEIRLYKVFEQVMEEDKAAGKERKKKDYNKIAAQKYVKTRESFEKSKSAAEEARQQRITQTVSSTETVKTANLEDMLPDPEVHNISSEDSNVHSGSNSSSGSASAPKENLFQDVFVEPEKDLHGDIVIPEDKSPDYLIPDLINNNTPLNKQTKKAPETPAEPNKAEQQMDLFKREDYASFESSSIETDEEIRTEVTESITESSLAATVSDAADNVNPTKTGTVQPADSSAGSDSSNKQNLEKNFEEKQSSNVVAEKNESLKEYRFPGIGLLIKGFSESSQNDTEEMKKNLEATLLSFGIDSKIDRAIVGPTVTRFELRLGSGVKLARITGLSDDIALALGASGVRIAAVPGEMSTVGIEVPNKKVSAVYLRDVLDSQTFRANQSDIAFAVGKDISNNCVVGNIAKLPHLLIAGTTGSGKSVCINCLVISLLYKAKPEDVRLIMIDPKMVELCDYNGIPHLLLPVVTDPKKAAGSLQWAVEEMLRRYTLMSDAGVRDIEGYNQKIQDNPERTKMFKLVVIIDELADLMMAAAREVEEYICRIAQMGRAAGVHLIIATQRPSANVITGLMKANIPSRIALAVASAMESRIILDASGAEKLVGRGDMLFAPLGEGKAKRVQGCYVSDDEIHKIVDYIKSSGTVSYDESIEEDISRRMSGTQAKDDYASTDGPDDVPDDYDEMLMDAIDVIMQTQQASVSVLQRKLKLGYARASRIVDQMEEIGIVGPHKGSKPRDILITKEKWESVKAEGNLKRLISGSD